MKQNKLRTRVIKGIADTYRVREVKDGTNGEVFLEVFLLTKIGVDDLYDEEYLCDIDGTLDETDTDILDDIDDAIEGMS